jgi:hypothetical protein
MATMATATAASALVAALLGAAAARGDTILPSVAVKAAPGPDEIGCGSREWPAIRRAVIAYCKGDDDRPCRLFRRAFRSCRFAPLLLRQDDGSYEATVDDWQDRDLLGTFRRDEGKWEMEDLSWTPPCDDD